MYGPGEPVTLKEMDKHGRTIMIRYQCRRCGCEHIETLGTALSREDWNYFGDITRFSPKGWHEIEKDTIATSLLCEKCWKEYLAFLNNEPPKEGEE